jgi:subtilisin-like proprotein convertase family protein
MKPSLASVAVFAVLAIASLVPGARAAEPAAPEACTAGQPCDDGNACTLDDTCNASGVCVGGPPPPRLRYCVSGGTGEAITIPSGPGGSMPYPSSLSVAAGPTVCKVTVTIDTIGHSNPDDIDMLLSGPAGQNAKIMSDVGGTADLFGTSFLLDDNAAASMPDGGPLFAADPSSPLGSGPYKPTDINDGPDNFPVPAPLPLGGSALSVFKNTNPNGTWNLWVADDRAGDSGFIRRWCLNISFLCTADAQCGDADSCTQDACVNGVCVNAFQDAPPPEVQGVQIAADKQTISWSPISGALSYDVVSGAIADLPVGPAGGDESCFDDVTASSTVDTSIPPAGEGLWYLVRAMNCYDNGTYGSQRDGTPRVTDTCF